MLALLPATLFTIPTADENENYLMLYLRNPYPQANFYSLH